MIDSENSPPIRSKLQYGARRAGNLMPVTNALKRTKVEKQKGWVSLPISWSINYLNLDGMLIVNDLNIPQLDDIISKVHIQQKMISERASQRKPDVKLCNGEWETEATLQEIKERQEQVAELHLCDNGNTIIRDMFLLSLQRLQVLKLQANRIDSVEGLTAVHMPYLHELSLSKNKLTVVRSLRKPMWQQLQILDFSQNYISQAHSLSQAGAPGLKGLRACDSSAQWQLHDMKFLFKLEAQSLNFLILRGEQLKPKMERPMRGKWTKLMIGHRL